MLYYICSYKEKRVSMSCCIKLHYIQMVTLLWILKNIMLSHGDMWYYDCSFTVRVGIGIAFCLFLV